MMIFVTILALTTTPIQREHIKFLPLAKTLVDRTHFKLKQPIQHSTGWRGLVNWARHMQKYFHIPYTVIEVTDYKHQQIQINYIWWIEHK